MFNAVVQPFNRLHVRPLSCLALLGLGLLVSLLTFGTGLMAQAAGGPGSVDPTFNSSNGFNHPVPVYAVAVQSDGKVIVGGYFSSYNGTARNSIARLNTDGSLDTSFNVGGGADSFVYAVAVQSDGKVIIGGRFTTYNGTARNNIARLNTDGSLDTSFNVDTGPEPNSEVEAVAVQSDGKIIIGGHYYKGTALINIARLSTDGSLDTSFNVGAGADSDVYAVTVQSDGKVIIGGAFTNYNETARNNIARLNTDGSLDTSFNIGAGPNSFVYAVAVQSDGKIIIGGAFTTYKGTARSNIARLNTDGSLDTSFNVGAGCNSFVYAVAVQSNGKIIIGGRFSSYNGTVRNNIARLNTDGSLDTSFNVGAGPNGFVQAVVVQSDGKIIIGGLFNSVDTYSYFAIARLLGDNLPSSTTTSLTASPNPSTFGQNVTFMAAVSPITATGTVSFTFNPGSTVTAPVVSGAAVYTTSSLSVGSHVITATYSGNSTYGGSVSQPVTQVVQSGCAQLVVTTVMDDGSGTNCGTLSYALLNSSSGVTITFALTQGNIITFTGSLTTTAKVKTGVTIYGGAFGGPHIILNGNGVSGNGLDLLGHNTLYSLTIEHFSGRELILESTDNRLRGVTVIASRLP